MGGVSNAIASVGTSLTGIAGSVPLVGGLMGATVGALTGQPGAGATPSSLLQAAGLVPQAELANANNPNASVNSLNQQAAQNGALSEAFLQNASGDTGNYNQAINQTQGQIGATQGQIGAAQGQIAQGNQAYNSAQAALQNQGGSALNLLQQAALGNSPSAAQAQLQSGLDQTIATQRALANSGNVSGMVSNQKEALDNAANLTQQSSNQAAQLRANQQVAAQGLYGTQATNYAAQAGQNAGVATNLANAQTGVAGAANTLAGTQANVAGLQQNALGQQLTAGQNYAALQNSDTTAAGNIGLGLAQSQQSAYNANQAALGAAIGGVASGAGAAGAALAGAAPAAASFLGSGSGGGSAFNGGTLPSEMTPADVGGLTTEAGPAAVLAYKGGIVPSGITNHQNGNFVHRHATNYDVGGRVPGQPKKPGNHIENDTVPAVVSPGELIIPNSHSHSYESSVEYLKDTFKNKKSMRDHTARTFLDSTKSSREPKVIENGKEIKDPKEKQDKINTIEALTSKLEGMQELLDHLSKKRKA